VTISNLLNQGKGALAANQLALATTSHNVANAATPGYSRQRVNLEAEAPVNYGRHRLGAGVRVGSVQRTHSDFVNRRIEEENSILGRAEGSADVLSQLESMFKDDAEQGVTKAVSQFFNDVRTLSTQPESTALRAAVRESAEAVTTRFRGINDSINQAVADLDRRVTGSVDQVNFLVNRIADLNRRIGEIEVPGSRASANDEHDQRDMAVQELAKVIPIQITQLEGGMINVSAGRMGVLVNGYDRSQLAAARAESAAHPNSMHVYLVGSDGKLAKDVTESVESGSLGGFINVRDKVIPELVGKIDTLAFNLAREVNGVHGAAYGSKGASGTDFFAVGGMKGAASSLEISDAVKKDLSSIAAGNVPNSPGDNRALLRIADLQDAKIFEDGKSNFMDFAASIVGGLGVEVRSVNENFETQKGLVDQLNVMREQTAGVSLDEEGINMIKFQKSFDASAKMIQVADQMLETVLNLKRF
jgi:flagellar hook-associated protein 1 FlgK